MRLRVCTVLATAWLLMWAGALALILISRYGLFGQPQDPLAGIYMVLLGLPWTLWLDHLPDFGRAFAAIAAPLFNAIILAGLCRSVGSLLSKARGG